MPETINDSVTLPSVPIERLQARLGLSSVCDVAAPARPLSAWKMEDDDAPILRWLFGQVRPRRHLEFGTWQGFGAALVLEACDATVWSLNLRDGEEQPDGVWAYYTSVPPTTPIASGANTRITPRGNVAVQTDGGANIGRLVHERGLGHRYCQVLCDSRDWDTSAYPCDFFDTAMIDGGHSADVVVSDTHKALDVLRPGGLMLWHDYCPVPGVAEACDSVRGVLAGIEQLRANLDEHFTDVFWIEPSWLLVGVKR